LIEKGVEMIAMNHNLKPADEAYRGIEKMIYKLSWQAARRYGGDWEDYASAANEAFMDAYSSYDPGQHTLFSTWLWWKIRGAITREIRKPCTEPCDMNSISKEEQFDCEAFIRELGFDARVVVRMVVESPVEVFDLLHHKDIGSVMRCGLQRKLKNIGWTVARISESFSEIRIDLKREIEDDNA
jgi:hypothetical protein